jgi:hypothetical protein
VKRNLGRHTMVHTVYLLILILRFLIDPRKKWTAPAEYEQTNHHAFLERSRAHISLVRYT